MPPSGTLELRTIGHACLLVLEDGKPIIATDPWLVGSVYWRSWWLEKYPSEEEIDLVRQSRYLYLTHSHLDHFHWPSLRRLGPLRVLHPAFPSYSVPGFLESHGFRNRTLAPLTWYALSDKVRVCSVPVPFDDSIMILDTPDAVIFNINDAAPRRALLERIRQTFNPSGKTAIALKSYSPASVGALTFQNGVRTPLKTKTDFVQVAIDISNALGAAILRALRFAGLFQSRGFEMGQRPQGHLRRPQSALVRHQDRSVQALYHHGFEILCLDLGLRHRQAQPDRRADQARARRRKAGEILRLARGRHRQAEELHGRALFRALDIPQGHRLAADDERTRAVLPDADARDREQDPGRL